MWLAGLPTEQNGPREKVLCKVHNKFETNLVGMVNLLTVD